MSGRPEHEIDTVAAAHERLVERIADLTTADVRRPSLLPGWSVGHVLTHLARNADSHVRRTEAAVAGVVVDQYPGGREGREAEIDAGAHRSVEDLLEDVRTSATTLDTVWQNVPDNAWAGLSRDVSGTERTLAELPSRRWQEVEVHLVDLDIGVSYRDWSDEFVAAWLPRLRNRMAPSPGDAPLSHLDDPRDELAWLYGRLERDDLPQPPAWG